jgi:hypothetical protein
MDRWLNAVSVVLVSLGVCSVSLGYDDDDLLCRSGWSPELLQQQQWQQYENQRMMSAQYQYAMTYGAAAEQQRLEMIRSARRGKLEKQAQRRAQIIANRKATTATESPRPETARQISAK